MYVDKAGKLASVDPLFKLARVDKVFKLARVDQSQGWSMSSGRSAQIDQEGQIITSIRSDRYRTGTGAITVAQTYKDSR